MPANRAGSVPAGVLLTEMRERAGADDRRAFTRLDEMGSESAADSRGMSATTETVLRAVDAQEVKRDGTEGAVEGTAADEGTDGRRADRVEESAAAADSSGTSATTDTARRDELLVAVLPFSATINRSSGRLGPCVPKLVAPMPRLRDRVSERTTER
jgi:hypothetical protein